MKDKKKAIKPKKVVKKASSLELKVDKNRKEALDLIEKVTDVLQIHEKLINRIKMRMGL
jgi:hypothetical protein|tara:strand:+ start:607 stop:783 length:177 start_codon:yes stop_codon:yes gene_type:complete